MDYRKGVLYINKINNSVVLLTIRYNKTIELSCVIFSE